MVNEGFIIHPKRKRSLACGTNAGNPKRAREAYLDRSGSQWKHRIRFIFPLTDSTVE